MAALSIKGIKIPTPYFLAPLNTGFGENGQPDDRLVRFHAERSGKGIGISYVGNVAVGEVYRSNERTLFFGSSGYQWRRLADVIRQNGSVAGIQIACRLPAKAPSVKWQNPDVAGYIARTRDQLIRLDGHAIEQLCRNFVETAMRAVDAGFQLIQIHAAHGYFLSQLLSRPLNPRTDQFGSDSISALKLIAGGIREVLPRVPLDVRVSIRDGIEPEDAELEHRLKQIDALVGLGSVDMVSLSSGHYEVDRFMIYPDFEAGHAVNLRQAVDLATRYPDVLWNTVGNILQLSKLDGASRENLTFSIGRALIADPDFVRKSLAGQFGAINACERAGHCHYYTRGRPHIACKVNSEI